MQSSHRDYESSDEDFESFFHKDVRNLIVRSGELIYDDQHLT